MASSTPDPTSLRFEFEPAHITSETQTRTTQDGQEQQWTLPHAQLPLRLNGQVVGYVEVHLHAAWAPDGVPDTSFGFTGRVNTRELLAALDPAAE